MNVRLKDGMGHENIYSMRAHFTLDKVECVPNLKLHKQRDHSTLSNVAEWDNPNLEPRKVDFL
jgi:hypothetical protein